MAKQIFAMANQEIAMDDLFIKFPKMARINSPCWVTEKIDGTNAQIYITVAGKEKEPSSIKMEEREEGKYEIFAGSRNRLITPSNDNHGFASWVRENASQLIDSLGIGRFYGEWWGGSIQRGYGKKEKTFSLFNPAFEFVEPKPEGLSAVPLLAELEEFSTEAVDKVVYDLMTHGSHASPGFMNPEGVVITFKHNRQSFKYPVNK